MVSTFLFMGSTRSSRRDVFRSIATTSHFHWPAYDSTPLYNRGSLDALEEDIRTIATVWFSHKTHDSVDDFIGEIPLQYVNFSAHDRYSDPTKFEMGLVFRVFLLKEVYGWEHETALLKYLAQRPSIR